MQLVRPVGVARAAMHPRLQRRVVGADELAGAAAGAGFGAPGDAAVGAELPWHCLAERGPVQVALVHGRFLTWAKFE